MIDGGSTGELRRFLIGTLGRMSKDIIATGDHHVKRQSEQKISRKLKV